MIGCALTVGGAYVVDATKTGPEAPRPMVNWDVVAKSGGLSDLARDGWKKIAG